MASEHSSTGEGILGLTASNNHACPSQFLQSAADLMAERAVPHKNSIDELWWSEETIFKQPSLVRSSPWFDKTRGGMPTFNTHTHTNIGWRKRTWAARMDAGYTETEGKECSAHKERLLCCWRFLNISSYFILSPEKKEKRENQSVAENRDLILCGVRVSLSLINTSDLWGIAPCWGRYIRTREA